MHTGNAHDRTALRQPRLHVLLRVTRATPMPDRLAAGLDVLLLRSHTPVQV